MFNRYIESATRMIARISQSPKIVVEKSTVPCKTADSMRMILDANSRPNVRFDILSNPGIFFLNNWCFLTILLWQFIEFLAEGTAIQDLFSPDRVLIGCLQTPEGLKAQATLASVYQRWVPSDRVICTNLWSSELTKLVSYDSNIS